MMAWLHRALKEAHRTREINDHRVDQSYYLKGNICTLFPECCGSMRRVWLNCCERANLHYTYTEPHYFSQQCPLFTHRAGCINITQSNDTERALFTHPVGGRLSWCKQFWWENDTVSKWMETWKLSHKAGNNVLQKLSRKKITPHLRRLMFEFLQKCLCLTNIGLQAHHCRHNAFNYLNSMLC